MVGVAKGIIARVGTVIVIVKFRRRRPRRAEVEITKKKRPSMCPRSSHGSLARYPGLTPLMVRSVIRLFYFIFILESDDEW